jgi:hypothetical protein
MAKKLFTFAGTKRAPRKVQLAGSVRVPKLVNEEDQPPFFIRGTKAGSKEEYWVSLALDKIQEQTGWGWVYQYPVYGGRNIRGGNVIDFLIYTPGRWTILDPKGRYWHTGIHEDQAEMQNVARKKNWILIEWFTDETPTRDAVLQFLRREMNV